MLTVFVKSPQADREVNLKIYSLAKKATIGGQEFYAE